MNNPMSEFKKNYTKQYTIQGKTFLFRSLSTKETSDIEKEIAKKIVSINDDSSFGIRKIETLALALVSVDGTPLNKFENILVELSKGANEKDLIKEEIGSWEDSFSTILFMYYLAMIKEKDAKYNVESEFLKGE